MMARKDKMKAFDKSLGSKIRVAWKVIEVKG